MTNNKIYAIRRYLALEDMLLGNQYGDIAYVGKTKRGLVQRLAEHTKDITHFEKTEWLMKNDHEIFLLEEDLDDDDVAEREQYWIDYFGTQFKLNRMRATAPTFQSKLLDGRSAMQRAKDRIKDLNK